MKINSEHKQRIHDVLITDLQRRIFKQYNERTNEFIQTDEDYDNAMSQLYTDVYNCNSINDINELLVNSTDLFTGYDDIIKFTLDGTLNYVLELLVKQYTEHPDGMGMQC